MTRSLFLALALLCAPAAALAQDEAHAKPLTVAEIADSAALPSVLSGAPAGATLFLVRYDSAGALRDVLPLVRRPSPAGRDSAMVALVRGALRPRLVGTGPNGAVIELRGGPSPSISVREDVTEDRPELSNMDAFTRNMESAIQRLLVAHPEWNGYQADAILSFTVSAAGVPGPITIKRGPENGDLRREILAVAARMRFRPGKIAGAPVPVLLEIPLTLVLQR